MKRVAVLQYEWPLQSHTVNLVKSLAAVGWGVDFFFKRCATGLIDIDALCKVPNVRVVDLDYSSRNRSSSFNLLVDKIRRLFEVSVQRLAFSPLLWLVLLQSRTHFRLNKYDCLIGVEKKGMIWAGMISQITGIPFIYYSLELYDEHHPYFFRRPGFQRLRRDEAFYHRKALATLVQDRQRGDYLVQSNGLSDVRMIYLPVSIPGELITEPRDFFKSKFLIPNDVPIVLFLGLIDEPRYCLNIARIARRNTDKFVLIFHGYGEAGFIDKLRDEGGPSVVISTELVSEEILPEIVASVSIGLAMYRNDCANDRLTAFSSEKIALYCRAGVPFIAFNSESYRSLKAKFDCCVLIDDVEEIPLAVQEILANYERFRVNAFSAFIACYRYEENVAHAIACIEGLLDASGNNEEQQLEKYSRNKEH